MEKTITTFNQRRALKSGIFRVLLAAMFFITTGAFAQFNDGYLTVFKVTNSAALANTGTAIVAEEYIPTTAAQSVPSYSVSLPTGTSGVVISGTATSAGAMSRSENGRYLIIPGYAAAVGAANSGFTSNGTARTLSGNGTMGAGVTGTIYSTANDLRGATSDDGTNFWFSGASIGTRYTNNGTTVTTVSTTSTNTRVINIFNGQLYYSTSSTSGGTLTGVYSVGTGKPVATGTTSANLVNATAPFGFSVSPDARTIYTINATDKVVRYTYSGTYNAASNTYSGGSWSAASTGMTLTSATGVAVDWNNYAFSTGANGAVIYATSPTLLVRGTDNGTGAITSTTLRTISGNNAFRGLAFSPVRQTVTKSATSPVASSLQTGVSDTVLFGFTLTANEGNSTIKKLILNQLGTAVAGTDITNFRLLEDANNNGVADTAEIAAALATGTVSGTQITFASISNAAITQGNAKNYLVIGNVSSTATSGATFIPSIVSDKTVNSVAYTTNLVNAGASYVTIGTSVPTGSTLTIAVPTIAYTGTLDALTTTQGTASATTSFSISGQNLTAGISINPPAGFEISTTANFASNVGSNGSPITVGAAGTVAATTVYVRLAASTPVGTYSGDIIASSTGAESVAIATTSSTVTSASLANQTITFSPIADKVYGDASFTVSATASSGLAVTYSSSNETIATVSGNTVTIVGVGEVTIFADQSGNSSYNPAPQAGDTFTVSAKALTVTGAVVTTKVYDGTDAATITGATLSGVLPGDTVTVSGNGTFADANAGDNKMVTSNLVLAGDDSAKYTLTQPALTGTISKADQVITFAPFGTKTTLDADFAAGATSASSAVNPIAYTSGDTGVATVTAGIIHIVSAGTSEITAMQEGNQNYNPATAIQTLTVIAPQFTAGNIVVLRAGTGAATLSNAATPVYFSEYTTSGTATVTIPVPSATAGNRVLISGSATSEGQLNLSGDGQYLTVTGYDAPAGIASVASSASATYNRVIGRMSANAQFAVTSLGSSLYTGNNIRSAVTQDGSRYWTSGANGGVYTIENAGTAATQVVSAPANTRTVSIFNNQLYVSSTSGTAGVYTVGTGLPTASTTAAITVTTADPYAYSIIDRGNGVRNMYVVSSTTSIGLTKWVSTNGGAWTQAGTSVPVSGVAFYGIAARANGSAVEVYASAPAGVYALMDTADATAAVSSTFTQIITAPTNTVFRGIAFAPTLVTPVVTNTNLSISGALGQPMTSYTITAINAPASYNATGLPDGVTVNTQTGVISGAPLHAGVFNVTLSATNAAGTGTAILTFTVEKGDQVITFDALPSKDVNDSDFDLTATSVTESINPIVYTSSNTAVATVTGTTVHIVGVGSTVITASQPATADYNAAIPVNQTLVVTSASLANQTISFDPLAEQTYGNAPFTLSATATSGLAVTYMSSNPAIASVSGNTVTIHNVGTVNITASQSGDSSYNAATDVVQPLNIIAKPLTVTGAVVTTKVYDNTATATVTGATLFGIVGTDEVTLVTGTATFTSVNAGTNIPVTTSYILTGAQAYRYTVVQPSLEGTITKANQAITFAAFPIKTDFEPAATLTSFSTTSAVNTVTYSSSNPAVADVSGTTLTITGIGTATITASQAESQNYNAVSTSQTIVVQKGLYLNQFTGASACPTNGNIALAPANATGTEVTRTTITCQSTGNVFNSTTLNATAAVNDASYIEFSVSAAAGNKLNLKSLYFFRQASNSAPSQLAIRYSTDGFATSNYVQYNAPASPTTGTYLNWDFADFSTPVGGTVTFRLYPYGAQRADGTGASSNTGTFRIDDVTVFGNVSPNCYDWTGTVSTDWNTGGNWCGGEVPTTLDDVVVNVTGNNPVIASGTANAHNLTVNAGAALTVSHGTNLNVDNILNVDTDATLTVEDGGALVQGAAATTNANSGEIVFNKKSSSLYRLDYTLWASPVAGQNLQEFSATTSSNRFYAYNTATDAYAAVAAATTDFATAKGYLIRMPNADATAGYNAGTQAIQFNGTFTGTPNNGTISQPLSTEGTRFNAVGNPYPSPINLADFFAANSHSLDASSGIYLWRKRNSGSSSSYATLSLSAFVANPSEGGGSENEAFYANPAQSDTWLIASGQGFIVRAANTASPALNFTNTMRRALPVGGVSFFRTGADTASRMWLNLTAQNGAGSQTAITYMEGTTTGFDLGYDAKKFAESNTISLYSLAENTSLTIQARPGFTTADVVPMGYVAPTATTYTVSLNRKDGVFAQGQNIYLKDKVALTLTNLTEGAYTFATEAGTFNDRFEIVYTTEGTLGNDDVTLNPDNVIVYGNKGVISINAGTTMINGVTVYDIRGAKVYSQDNINNTQTAITNLTAEQQVLIVEVQTAKGKVSKHIVY